MFERGNCQATHSSLYVPLLSSTWLYKQNETPNPKTNIKSVMDYGGADALVYKQGKENKRLN